MLRQGVSSDKKPRGNSATDSVDQNASEQLNIKHVGIEFKKTKGFVHLASDSRRLVYSSKLALPRIKYNSEITPTPPPSPIPSTRPSPTVARRKRDRLATSRRVSDLMVSHCQQASDIEYDYMTAETSTGRKLRRSRSHQNIRGTDPIEQPTVLRSRGAGPVSPRLLHRRSTIDQGCLRSKADISGPWRCGSGRRRFSAGVVPSIRVEETQESLREKVKKFSESLEKFRTETIESNKNDDLIQDDRGSPDEEMFLPKPATHYRSRSLPNIFPALSRGSDMESETSRQGTSFGEDMKLCRYLRIPDMAALTIEQIFEKSSKPVENHKDH